MRRLGFPGRLLPLLLEEEEQDVEQEEGAEGEWSLLMLLYHTESRSEEVTLSSPDME